MNETAEFYNKNKKSNERQKIMLSVIWVWPNPILSTDREKKIDGRSTATLFPIYATQGADKLVNETATGILNESLILAQDERWRRA